jgi:hypothetical protein
MILQILADAGQVIRYCNAARPQFVARTDA